MSQQSPQGITARGARAYQPIEPRMTINIRTARPDGPDLKFIDDLQKQHTRMVGFMHYRALKSYIESGDVLIAESPPACAKDGRPIPNVRGNPIGYIIGRDRYFKREDVGIIYQLNVQPGKHRKLIGASLVSAMFERAAWGCKLFCCWCAQDIEANHFWESIGFVPLAFRAGSEKKSRMHIFWQKRIREGDESTPWWFPSMTTGGAIREGRLVLPIPPGTHWSDAKPLVLPGVEAFQEEPAMNALPAGSSAGSESVQPVKKKRRSTRRQKLTEQQAETSNRGGIWFAPKVEQSDEQVEDDSEEVDAARLSKASPSRMYHPKYVEAARELCARFLHEVQSDGGERLIAASNEQGAKHDVRKMLEESDDRPREVIEPPRRLLDAA